MWRCYHDIVEQASDGWQFASRPQRVAGTANRDIDWLPLVDPDESPA
jgi:hypothetical protein